VEAHVVAIEQAQLVVGGAQEICACVAAVGIELVDARLACRSPIRASLCTRPRFDSAVAAARAMYVSLSS
jgi:hypothetical protein